MVSTTSSVLSALEFQFVFSCAETIEFMVKFERFIEDVAYVACTLGSEMTRSPVRPDKLPPTSSWSRVRPWRHKGPNMLMPQLVCHGFHWLPPNGAARGKSAFRRQSKWTCPTGR